MQGDNIISGTFSSSVLLFLQVQYLQISTTLNKPLIFMQRYLQSQTLYYSLCIPLLTHHPDPLRRLISLLKPPTFLNHLHHLCQNITLTPHSTPLVFNWKTWHSWERNNNSWERNNFINQICFKIKWLLSNQRHTASQRIPKCSKLFYQVFIKTRWPLGNISSFNTSFDERLGNISANNRVGIKIQ